MPPISPSENETGSPPGSPLSANDAGRPVDSNPGNLSGTPALVLCVILGTALILTSISLLHPDVGGNAASRFATMESLVERGTWAIDDSTFVEKTADKVRYRGRAFSSKPPVMPLIGAGVYAVTRKLTGWSLAANPTATTTAVRLFLQVLPFAIFLFYFWRFLGYWMSEDRARRWLFLTVALATLLLSYSAKLNNHAPAAFLVFGSFYNAFGISRLGWKLPSWLAAGFFAGLAVTFDLAAIPFLLAVGIYLFLQSPMRTASAFLLPAAVPIAANIALNIQITGSPLPIYFQGELYWYAGSYWANPASYDALDEPKWLYLLHITVGHRGWFAMTPILVLALPGVRVLWRGGRSREALVIAGTCLFVLSYYWLRSTSYGGTCGGMRWLIVTLPLWLLAVGAWLDRNISREGARRWYLVLAIVGFCHAANIVWDPWTRSGWERLFQLLEIGSV